MQNLSERVASGAYDRIRVRDSDGDPDAEAVGLEWADGEARAAYQADEGGHWWLSPDDVDNGTVRFEAPPLAPINQVTVEVSER